MLFTAFEMTVKIGYQFSVMAINLLCVRVCARACACVRACVCVQCFLYRVCDCNYKQLTFCCIPLLAAVKIAEYACFKHVALKPR